MSFIEVKLTLTKCGNDVFYFKNISNITYNFTKNEVFKFIKCQNYTIDNFTIRKPISGNVPGK
jgi:hypothetical protein